MPQAVPDASVSWQPLSSDEMADGGSGNEAAYSQQQQAWARQQLQQLEQQRDAQLAQAQARFAHQQRIEAYQQTQPLQAQRQRVQLLHPDGSSITTMASSDIRRPTADEEQEEMLRRKPKRKQPELEEPEEEPKKEEPKEDEPGKDKESRRPHREPATDQPGWRRACGERCDERSMEVTGVGVHVVPSDKAEVRTTIEYRRLVNTTKSGGELPLDELRSLISEVQTEVSSKAAAVVAFLTNGTMARHISKLRTSSLGLEPLYEYQTGRQQLMGYRASNSLTFRVDVAYAGKVIDSIVEIGVSRIDGVSFVASPKILNKARHVAIQNAVEDAINQAMVRRATHDRATQQRKSALSFLTQPRLLTVLLPRFGLSLPPVRSVWSE